MMDTLLAKYHKLDVACESLEKRIAVADARLDRARRALSFIACNECDASEKANDALIAIDKITVETIVRK